MTKVIAFTGIPGTRVQSALEDFLDYIEKEEKVRNEVVSVEKYFWAVFCQLAPKYPIWNSITGFRERELNAAFAPNWWKLLRLPIQSIRQIWSVAIEKASEDVLASKADYCFVTFHALYYSDNYRWGLSAVNPFSLKNLGIATFVTLTDDVFDIHRRRATDVDAIQESVEISSEDKWKRLVNLIELTVKKLVQYIGLRQDEIILSDLFASALDVKSHVFSVKHPKRTLWELIKNPEISAYFSHPISAVRRELRVGELFASSHLFKEIDFHARKLRNELTLIEPTTIDELRIQSIETKSENGTEQHLLPLLTRRWDLLESDPDDLLSVDNLTNDGSPSIIPPEIIDNLGLRERWEQLINGIAPLEIQREISFHLRYLYNKIEQDICWRDHHLVDQTKHLIVFRPTTDGKSSSGVQREIEYFSNVRSAFDQEKKAIIYHPKSEREKTAVYSAKQLLENLVANPHTKGTVEKFTRLDAAKKEEILDSVSQAIREISEVEPIVYRVISILRESKIITNPIGKQTGALDADTTTRHMHSESGTDDILFAQIVEILTKQNHYIEVARGDQINLGLIFAQDESQFFRDSRQLSTASTMI